MINVSILCVFISFLLMVVSKIPASIAMIKTNEGYNNRHPRKQMSELRGWGARAVAGHQNAIESFVGFAPAVLFAQISNVDYQLLSNLSIAFVISRILYHVFYIANFHAFRSTIWSIGYGITVAIFVMSF
jgi:uncharacterized MAPEG superfamily protein